MVFLRPATAKMPPPTTGVKGKKISPAIFVKILVTYQISRREAILRWRTCGYLSRHANCLSRDVVNLSWSKHTLCVRLSGTPFHTLFTRCNRKMWSHNMVTQPPGWLDLDWLTHLTKPHASRRLQRPVI